MKKNRERRRERWNFSSPRERIKVQDLFSGVFDRDLSNNDGTSSFVDSSRLKYLLTFFELLSDKGYTSPFTYQNGNSTLYENDIAKNTIRTGWVAEKVERENR